MKTKILTDYLRALGEQFQLFDTREEENAEKVNQLLGRLVTGAGPTIVSAASLREQYRSKNL